MNTKFGRFVLLVGALGCALAMGSPAIAQGHGGGHGGGGGGGGHAGGGGGGHAAAGGGHGFSGGGHFAPSAHAYAGGYAHAGAYGGHSGTYGGYVGHMAGYGTAGGHNGGYAGYGNGYYHGYSTGARWGGGYWGGGYWPRAYYGLGFSWFLPVLPLAYATYWYDGIPFYYANDVYYTYDPGYEGYVATDPPPVAAASGSAVAPAAAGGTIPAGADAAAGAAGQVFMYPKNGQSEAQQSTDKRECQQWASSQTDPSHVDDYRRAMMACIEGRGYSAQ